MTENWIAVADKTAPRNRRAKWHQLGLKHALEAIHAERPADYEHLVYDGVVGMALEKTYTNDGVGPHGWEQNLGLDYRFDDHVVDVEYNGEDEWLDRLHLLGEQWITYIADAIQADQDRSIFSKKEFAVFYAARKPTWGVGRTADALDISSGNVQGKQGRINDKLDTVSFTNSLRTEVRDEHRDDGGEDSHGYRLDFLGLQRADSEDLPISNDLDTTSVVKSRAELYLKGGRDYEYDEFVDALTDVDGLTAETIRDELDRLAWRGDVELGTPLRWTGDE